MTHNITPALTDRAVPIDKLTPHPQNARTRSPRAQAELRASLEQHGQYRAVVARALKGGRLHQEHTGDKPVLEATGVPHDFTDQAVVADG